MDANDTLFSHFARNDQPSLSIPDAAKLGMRTVSLFEELDTTDEVTAFLNELGLSSYAESFQAHGVTGRVLMSLSVAEMRDTLGVSKLRDRRLISESVRYVANVLRHDSRMSLPEDGRILTHLSNEVTVLAWIRLSVVFLIVAVTALRNDPGGLNTGWPRAVGCSLCGLSVLTVVHGMRGYWTMYKVIESGSPIVHPGDPKVAASGALLASITIALLYAVMEQRAEEASIILLISI